MHEMSIAVEVCSIAQRHVPRDELENIVEVGLEVGDGSGIEPDSLEFWLESMLTHPPFKAAKPVIKRVPGDVLRVSYLEVDDGRPDD
ncbi:MAG: hydrogenase maturation nickel metallochaperone HypA [Gemmatimonadota bacterium]|nr:hydrogenase maturation nickel metallochaperone HypA [Gemmatimonadota bacterium]